VEVDFNKSPKEVRTSEGKMIRGKAVIIATGAAPRTLGVPGEDALRGQGVSYCAVCDGPFFRDRHVAVVGGGDAAFDEGLYLTKYASKVTIIHRRDEFRAQKLLIDRAKNNPKIEFLTSTVVEKVNGEGGVASVTVRNLKSGEVYELPLGGLFIYVGNIPNTGMFGDGIQVDENGFIQVDETMATGCPGVYVAGDVRKNPLKQVVTAAADGSIAALAADKYLDNLEADMSPVHAERAAERAETWETAY
jgi:thioredoxin reductase (NADPH)